MIGKMNNTNTNNNNTVLNISYLTSGIYNSENLKKNILLQDKNISDKLVVSIMNKKNSYNKLSNGISNILDCTSYKTWFYKDIN
mgnify:FL=1